ncbi:DUF6262 family protein [Agathobacter sp.]
MADNTKNLEAGWKKRSDEAKQKALAAIERIKASKGAVNFNSVHMESGLSKNYLYTNDEIRAEIIMERDKEQARLAAYHKKYDKTSKSKDVVIASKDKYIARLETEINQLKKEINQLRALLYESNKS